MYVNELNIHPSLNSGVKSQTCKMLQPHIQFM
jgi:hypothetical protein